ncbi:hypothetical protein [Pleomorphomonas sp. JP5]|nr:hypothetical protein [Pleomorphomonas sp. JP5]MCM5556306.1 hypothetical protein [Pleomorphomonas sp. JP5]
MSSRSRLVSLFVRAALMPLDRPGLALVVSLGMAVFAGTIVVAGALR